jgi:hypothetical protein
VALLADGGALRLGRLYGLDVAVTTLGGGLEADSLWVATRWLRVGVGGGETERAVEGGGRGGCGGILCSRGCGSPQADDQAHTHTPSGCCRYGDAADIATGGGSVLVEHMAVTGRARIASGGGDVALHGLEGNAEVLTEGGRLGVRGRATLGGGRGGFWGRGGGLGGAGGGGVACLRATMFTSAWAP